MKQLSPDIMVSRKFLTRLRGRIFYAFPPQIAEELMRLIMLYVTGEDYSMARESVSEITRSFFSYIIFDLGSAVERSRIARAVAARRRAAREAACRALAEAAPAPDAAEPKPAAAAPGACLSQGEIMPRGRPAPPISALPILSVGVAAPRAP